VRKSGVGCRSRELVSASPHTCARQVWPPHTRARTARGPRTRLRFSAFPCSPGLAPAYLCSHGQGTEVAFRPGNGGGFSGRVTGCSPKGLFSRPRFFYQNGVARIPRNLSVRPGYSVHKVWRGHNREWNLKTGEQKQKYLDFMNQDLESNQYEAGSTILALTLMSNHTHELFDVSCQKLFSNHMRRHHSRYGRYFNDLKNRRGKVAEDRPHTTLIADDHHKMMCTFYIHANPHRAKIGDPERYEYSTHKLYAYGKRSIWMRNVALPEWYLRLGKTMAQRQKKYRVLFARYLKSSGLRKQTFLRKLFFGPIPWMLGNEERVIEWRKSLKLAPS